MMDWLQKLIDDDKAAKANANDSAPKDPRTPKNPIRELAAVMDREYDLIHSAGKAYAIPKSGPRIAQPFGAPLQRKIIAIAQDRMVLAIPRSTAETVQFQLERFAFDGDETPLALRFHHDPVAGRVVIDLGGTDGRCVVVDERDWDIGPIPDDVVFRRSHTTRPLPEPKRGGSLGELAGLLALEPYNATFAVIVGWVIGLPFAADVRPGLLLTGPYGSGKSTRLRLAASIFEPSDDSSLGKSFGHKNDDDEVRALHRAVPLWDNLTSISGNASDSLCTLITGTAREGRQLYSNADMSTHPIKRPVGLTAVGVPAGLRPDALDRLIVAEVPPITERLPDSDVQARFDAAHPRLLGAACDAVSAALRWRHSVPSEVTRYRMAGHARVLAAVDLGAACDELSGLSGLPPLLTPYGAQLRHARERAVAEDVFGNALITMMERLHHWEGTAKGLMDTAKRYLSDDGLNIEWSGTPKIIGWPSSPRGVPTALAHLKQGLNDMGITWETRPLGGRTHYAFTYSKREA